MTGLTMVDQEWDPSVPSPSKWWAGQGGDSYTARNRVDWRARVPFWREVLNLTGARSVYEFGCNAGWNLSAIRRAYPDVECWGHDINYAATSRARAAGLKGVACANAPVFGGVVEARAELAFTCGVLIHIAPSDLESFMREVIRLSAQYVLAVEYAADEEQEVEYRGQTGLLWKRPYGKRYEAMGLKLIREWDAPYPAFDHCRCWLLEKP